LTQGDGKFIPGYTITFEIKGKTTLLNESNSKDYVMMANNFIFHISLNHDGFMITNVWWLDLEGRNLSDMGFRISSFHLDINWLDFLLDCFQY
jgi:hypothetical protein